MQPDGTRQYNWEAYLITLCFSILVACRAGEPAIETEPAPLTTGTTATISLEATRVLNTTPHPLPLETSTIRPSPSTTSTPLPTILPTVAPLQRVRELPVGGDLLAVSTDHTLLAIVNRSMGMVYGIDLATYEIKWQFGFDSRFQNVASLDISPDGRFLAFGGAVSPNGIAAQGLHENVFVFSVDTAEWIHTFLVRYEVIDSLSFSPDSTFLAASADYDPMSLGYGIMVWDLATGQLAYQLASDDYSWDVLDTTFVPYHPNLLAITTVNQNILGGFEEGEREGGLYFWDFSSQQLQEAITGTVALAVATSPNGRLVAAHIDGDIRLWDVDSETEVLSISVGEAGYESHLTLTDTGVFANFRDRGNVLTIWNLQGTLLDMLEIEGTLADIAFVSDIELLVASYTENEAKPIEVWRIND
jgi:WD40 repeat protein